MIPNESVVREVLARHAWGMHCRGAVEDAWETVKNEYATTLPSFRRKSTRRALVWEHTIQNAVSRFEENPGVLVRPENDTYSFVFDETVKLRFKKANPKLFSSNYPTQLSLQFHTHDSDLFGHKGLHRAEVLHVFDQTESKLDWVGVVGRNGNTILWSFELPFDSGVVKPFPVAPMLPPAAERVLRVVEPRSDNSAEIEPR